ncbi:39S ribosomal protein L46, mitochondrial isoform X2 [Esox lucius]|uniref:39S ribosomal protein L46, mitochondrial isoform X2 n=1 Tax=Esox lucius TaxID=8010 RepID=UPI00147685CD|nr:39S ribosomal protein L46, mitochondrial isoform X2 [Esox lucius]
MAAPCSKIVSRPWWQFIKNVGWTGLNQTVVRQLSRNNACGAAAQTKSKTERIPSQWKLHGAVCLQRLPVISQERNPIEDQFAELIHQMELERSLVSEHELRLLEDAERVRRKQAEDYDSDEEAEYGDQETITALDQEDAWEQKLKKFQLAPRVSDLEDDHQSVGRCLGDSLVLLTEETLGQEKVWLLPQVPWQAGETLRQTAERALNSLPEADFKATFLGSAPCGVYRYKLPKAVRTESCQGAKVFFFKALLSGHPPPSQNGPFRWVKKSELPDYLKPAYLEKVNRFILDL